MCGKISQFKINCGSEADIGHGIYVGDARQFGALRQPCAIAGEGASNSGEIVDDDADAASKRFVSRFVQHQQLYDRGGNAGRQFVLHDVVGNINHIPGTVRM
jgi:hypothetical protein